jgi:hypothetical protein
VVNSVTALEHTSFEVSHLLIVRWELVACVVRIRGVQEEAWEFIPGTSFIVSFTSVQILTTLNYVTQDAEMLRRLGICNCNPPEQEVLFCVISDFHHSANEIFDHLGFYAE